MRPFIAKFYSSIALIFLLFITYTTCQTTNDTTTNTTPFIPIPVWLNYSQTQYNQFLADQYTYFITSKGNRVWAGALSLAWNQLKRGLINGSDAKFITPTDLQQKIVDNFNSEVFNKSQISESSYYVTSGFGQQTVDRINVQVRQKFPDRTMLPLNDTLGEKDFISFAYLFKKFKFSYPFNDANNMTFNGVSTTAFEALNSKQKRQVYYKYYNNSKDFMIGIRTDNNIDEALFWKTNQTEINSMKFSKILQTIDFYYQMPSLNLRSFDKFRMPVLDYEFERKYKQMQGLYFANPGLQDYVIKEMNQKLKVRITKKGVEMQNQGKILTLLTSVFGSKTFYLDSDFWVILRQKNKHPYLVMLVKQPKQIWTEPELTKTS